MKLDWSGPQECAQEGKPKPITVETTLEDRFVLYNAGGGMVPTMWGLHDRVTKSTHYLNGKGWDGAKTAAAERIDEILNPPPKPVKKPRRKR